MSRNHRKNLSRGLKVALEERVQRVRTSRHGKPQMRRIRRIVTDKNTGKVTVSISLVPVTEPYKARVAAGPTGTYGAKNTGGASAGRKAPKKDS